MIKEIPEAMMINVPDAFFKHQGKEVSGDADREKMFRHYYEWMGTEQDKNNEGCFYHFISRIPVHEVTTVYVCFKGFVQYKAIVVQFLRMQPVHTGTYHHPKPRNWVVTTGPVVKAPAGMVQKGFRGFRYTNKLF